MHLSRPMKLGLALPALFALGVTVPRPAAAQSLRYILSGVTFSDGAVATGYFNFNPTTKTFGDFDFTTTNGVGDGLPGAHYTSASSIYTYRGQTDLNSFFFITTTNPATNLGNYLILISPTAITAPGLFPLSPGSDVMEHSLAGSGELVDVNADVRGVPRTIATGSLLVASAPVPEASTTVSLGLLLALGMGGLVIAARRKRTAVKATSAL